MHADHGIEIVFAHTGEQFVANEACVVDDDVQAAEGLHGEVQCRRAGAQVADVAVERHRLAASGPDLLGHAGRTAQIVDDHAGALACEQQRVLPAETLPAAGDHGDFSRETTCSGTRHMPFSPPRVAATLLTC